MKVRIYPKVFRRDNDKGEWKPELNKDKIFMIQEKIDGSNLSFGIQQDKFKIWSRTQTITTTEVFGKTNLDEIRNLESKIRDLMKKNGYKSILISGELLGQGKIGYNKHVKSLKECFYLFDIWTSVSDEKPIKELRAEGNGTWMEWGFLEDVVETTFKDDFNLIPLIKTMPYEEWEKDETNFYSKYIEKNGNVLPSLIDEKHQREGVVIKISGSGMRYKIVSAQFREKMKVKTKSKEKYIIDRISEMFITDGRIEKGLQKMFLEKVFEGDRANKKNYRAIAKNSHIIIEDIIEEEQEEILKMVFDDLRKLITKKVFNYIEDQGIVCACCEEKVMKSDLHPETRICPKCGKYALKRKLMLWNEDKEEYYLKDQVTGEVFNCIDGKIYKFEKEDE